MTSSMAEMSFVFARATKQVNAHNTFDVQIENHYDITVYVCHDGQYVAPPPTECKFIAVVEGREHTGYCGMFELKDVEDLPTQTFSFRYSEHNAEMDKDAHSFFTKLDADFKYVKDYFVPFKNSRREDYVHAFESCLAPIGNVAGNDQPVCPHVARRTKKKKAKGK